MRSIGMLILRWLRLCVIISLMASCRNSSNIDTERATDTPDKTKTGVDTISEHTNLPATSDVDTKGTNPAELVGFAKTLIGIPYKYGSIAPQDGFDCSGFITYVFNHFGVSVPRSSRDFEHTGNEIDVSESKEGDLILFTGTDSTDRDIGHMGIIVQNSDTIKFIHSTSGKANGVTITPLNDYYIGRYVKTIRIFN
jgi:cell wall-associated NlpC family hydrolase